MLGPTLSKKTPCKESLFVTDDECEEPLDGVPGALLATGSSWTAINPFRCTCSPPALAAQPPPHARLLKEHPRSLAVAASPDAVAAVPSFVPDDLREPHQDCPVALPPNTICPRLFSRRKADASKAPVPLSSDLVAPTSLVATPLVAARAPIWVNIDSEVTAAASLGRGDKDGYHVSSLEDPGEDTFVEDDGSGAEGEVAPGVARLLDLPESLARAACLRCVKHLEMEPGFGCHFPSSHSKCTWCTRLKSKCEAVPSFADATARALLALEGRHVLLAYLGHAGKALVCARSRVVVAAKAFTRDVQLGACAQPQTQEDILREILYVQQEQLMVLCALLPSRLSGGVVPAEGVRGTKKRLGVSVPFIGIPRFPGWCSFAWVDGRILC